MTKRNNWRTAKIAAIVALASVTGWNIFEGIAEDRATALLTATITGAVTALLIAEQAELEVTLTFERRKPTPEGRQQPKLKQRNRKNRKR